MFFALSKILSFLCFPLSLALVLLGLFAWLQRGKHKRLAWALFWAAVLGLWACSLRPVATVLLRPLERDFEGAAVPAQAEAIAVLGGMIDLGRSDDQHLALNPNADRFVEAVELARKLPKAVLIFSGGNGRLISDEPPEAPILKSWAEKMGIPAGRVIAEDRSKNTYQNAVETKRILDKRGLRSVVVVTSAYHMRRSLRCFRKLGVNATPYAVDFRATAESKSDLDAMCWIPDVANLEQSTAAIKEYVGLLIYKVQKYN